MMTGGASTTLAIAGSSTLGMSPQVACIVAGKMWLYDVSIVPVQRDNEDGTWWWECFRYYTEGGEIRRERFEVRCPADWTCWAIARSSCGEAA